MYYGLVRKPEDQLPGLISAYVQVGGRRHRIGTGSGKLRGREEVAVWRIESVGVKLLGGWYWRG